MGDFQIFKLYKRYQIAQSKFTYKLLEKHRSNFTHYHEDKNI